MLAVLAVLLGACSADPDSTGSSRTGESGSAASKDPAGPEPTATGDVQLRVPNYGPAPDYVLVERVGADAEPKDPHGTLNLLGLSKDGLRQYEDVSGLSVWSGVSRYGTACLLVAHPGQGLLEGIGDARCFPDGLDPIVDLTGCSPTPAATECSGSGVFGDLPTGSLVRFVLKGDRVDVYVYVRAPDPSASATSWTWPSASPIDTTDWVVYESKQYGFSIKHPPGWEVLPAKRDWTLEADAGRGQHRGEGAQETFKPPANDLFVAVWSAPAKDTPETLEGVAAWVERYCKMEGSSCSGPDRSVPLCNGTDCDPGLLVTVDNMYGATDDLSFMGAFFTGGKHKGRMIGVEVGRPEGDGVVAKYGGARRLLEGFLSGMGVCPARPDQAPAGCP